MGPCAWVILPWFLAAYPYLPAQLNVPSLKGSSLSAHKARWGGRWWLTSPSPGLVWHIPALGGWLKPPPCPRELGEWGQGRAWEGQVGSRAMCFIICPDCSVNRKGSLKWKKKKKKLRAHPAAPASLFSSLAFSHFAKDASFFSWGLVLEIQVCPGLCSVFLERLSSEPFQWKEPGNTHVHAHALVCLCRRRLHMGTCRCIDT